MRTDEKIDKYLNEESELSYVADNMARLIMGDQKVALRNLNKMPYLVDFGSMKKQDYNKIYGQLYKEINAAIEKALNSV